MPNGPQRGGRPTRGTVAFTTSPQRVWRGRTAVAGGGDDGDGAAPDRARVNAADAAMAGPAGPMFHDVPISTSGHRRTNRGATQDRGPQDTEPQRPTGAGRETLRAIAPLVGGDRRACWCPRCVVTRTGIYRRSRLQTDRRIEIETRVFGILVRRRITPLTSGS